MDTSIENQVEQITGMAAMVAAEHQAHQEALAKSQAAGATLLEAVIKAALPALKAIGTRPERAYQVTGSGEPGKERSKTTHYPHRCLALNCEQKNMGPNRDAPRDNQGEWEGQDFMLREDGVLIEMTYGGTWSRWQGSSWEWEARVIKEYPDAATAIKDGWGDVDYYVERIAQALASAEGTRKEPTAKALAQAERMAAVAKLVKP